MLMPTLRRGLGAVVALSLAASIAACGDDAGTTTVPPSDTTTTSMDTPETTAEAPPSGDEAAWCSAVIDFDEAAAELPDATTTEEFDDLVAEILPGLRVLAAGAPSAIRADLDLIVESIEQYLGGDESALISDAYFDAFARLEGFVLDVCDYELVG